MWGSDPEQKAIQQRQQSVLRRDIRNSRDAVYQQRLDTSPYMHTSNTISSTLGTVGNIVGQNVNPILGQGLQMLGERPDMVISGANTLGNMLAGENTWAGRALHRFVDNHYRDMKAADDLALSDYVRRLVGAYMTDNRNANPRKVKWRIIKNIREGRHPYYKLNGRIRPELVNMSEKAKTVYRYDASLIYF